jgi:hypothetical protein
MPKPVCPDKNKVRLAATVNAVLALKRRVLKNIMRVHGEN